MDKISIMSSKQNRSHTGQLAKKRRKGNKQNTIYKNLVSLIEQNDSDRVNGQVNVSSDSDRQDKRMIDDNLMTKYRPLIRRGNEEKHVDEAEDFLKLNKIDCTFVGMSRAINKLNHELKTVRMKLSSDQIMTMQTTLNENRKRVMDFKLFLTKKTYNMFRVTFTMVRNCFKAQISLWKDDVH